MIDLVRLVAIIDDGEAEALRLMPPRLGLSPRMREHMRRTVAEKVLDLLRDPDWCARINRP